MGLTELEDDWRDLSESPDKEKAKELRDSQWDQMTSSRARWFFEELRADVDSLNLDKINAWFNGSDYDKQTITTATEIMQHGDKEGTFRPLYPIFQAHIACALEVATHKRDNKHCVIDRQLTQKLIQHSKKLKVPLGLMIDLANELAGQETRKPHGVVFAPFALVWKVAEEENTTTLAQFRLERLADGRGDVYITPDQAFMRMDNEFYKSIFEDAKRIVSIFLKGQKTFCGNCDIRVRIEKFSQTNTLNSVPLFDAEGCGKAHEFFELEPKQGLSGPSASGAAAWGLYFLLADKKPDPGIIVVARANSETGVSRVNEVGAKVRAIAKSECVDTIIVADENNWEQAEEALRECGKLDEISLVNITPPTLEQLVKERAKLVSEVLTSYLDALPEKVARLSPDYPAHLCSAKSGTTGFDKLRRMVQVVEYRSAYGPSPVPWDEHAGEQFRRAVVLGNPGYGKTWLLIYEALRLARTAATKLRERTIGLDEVVLPIFIPISDMDHTHVTFEHTLAELAGRSLSQKFKCFVQQKFKTDRCVILLDGWEEAQQNLRRRIVNFARHFPNPRILLTSRIAGYNFGHPPVLDAQELKLLDFDQEQIESFIRVWYEGDTQTCKDFLEMLALHDDLRCAARIPGLLTAMCLKGRDRRVELYEIFVNYMLQNVPSPPVDLIQLLQKLALNHLNSVGQQFSRAFLQATITASVEALGSSAPNIAELEELIIRTGVIRADRGHVNLWSFSLPAFRDYLAARELAEQINNSEAPELEQILVLPTGRVTVQRLVDEKADDPTWKAVLAFLAGRLPVDKALLLAKQLGSPGCVNRAHSTLGKKEDRLLLVARCLNEINIRE